AFGQISTRNRRHRLCSYRCHNRKELSDYKSTAVCFRVLPYSRQNQARHRSRVSQSVLSLGRLLAPGGRAEERESKKRRERFAPEGLARSGPSPARAARHCGSAGPGTACDRPSSATSATHHRTKKRTPAPTFYARSWQ